MRLWLGLGVTAKDLIIEVTRRIGAGGALSHTVEFAGEATDVMSVEARMTIQSGQRRFE